MIPSARLASGEEQGIVEAITRAAYAQYETVLDRPPQPVTEDFGPRIARGEAFIVRRGDEDVAVAVVERHPDHLMIFNLAVLPSAQRLGLGRWMLGFVEDRARSEGMEEVRLYTNSLMVRNIRLYSEAGYRETGRGEHPQRAGWTVVYMAKRMPG